MRLNAVEAGCRATPQYIGEAPTGTSCSHVRPMMCDSWMARSISCRWGCLSHKDLCVVVAVQVWPALQRATSNPVNNYRAELLNKLQCEAACLPYLWHFSLARYRCCLLSLSRLQTVPSLFRSSVACLAAAQASFRWDQMLGLGWSRAAGKDAAPCKSICQRRPPSTCLRRAPLFSSRSPQWPICAP